MKITISIGGRFHAFDLAKQLQARGHLHSLITSYPKRKTAEWEIDPSKVQTVLSHELLCRAFRKLGRNSVQHDLNCRYDRIASRRLLSGTDVVIAWSGMAFATLNRAKEIGAKTILERNSAHICRQRELLQEEAELTGTRVALPDQRTVDQELAEYDQADYVCVPSRFAYRSFVNQGFPTKRLLVVPFGVDAQQFKPDTRQDDKFRVIYCGSLTLQKGVHYLLQAFHELKLPDADLWLVGTSSTELTRYLRIYGGPHVMVKGAFPQQQLHHQYSQASVLCMPSIQDGFGMVVSQAMACGIPVICTENTGARDIIRESVDGFTIPVRHVEALKERLLFLYSHREAARQMGDAARQRILDGFTWDHYGDRIVSEYSRVLSETLQDGGSTTVGSRHSTVCSKNALAAASL